MRNKKLKRILSAAVALLILCLCFAGCTANPNRGDFKVMLPDGEGYTVINDQICRVQKGGTAIFEVDILPWYRVKSISTGEYSDGKLEIKDINRNLTVRFVCEKLVEVSVSATGGLIKSEPVDADTYVVGSTALVTVEPLPNFYLDKLYINDIEQEFETDIDGKLSLQFVLSQNTSIKAVCLGNQYLFSYSINGAGQLLLGDKDSLSGTDQSVVRYGDKLDLTLVPQAGHKINFIEIDGQVIVPTDDTFSFSISKNLSFAAYFSGDDDVRLVHNENNGEVIGNIFNLYVPVGDYLNIDHCYGKLRRGGWTLAGFNTKPDGSGNSYNLGALLKMTKDTVLYAEWEKQTDANDLVFDLIGDTYAVSGLSAQGIAKQPRKIVVPESFDGKPVVAVQNNAFAGVESIEEVVLHTGIVSVGTGAFKNCPALSRLVVTESITQFDLTAIEGCDALETIRFNNTSESRDSSYHGTPSYRFAALDAPNRAPRYILVAGSSGNYGIDATMFNSQMDKEIIAVGVSLYIGVISLFSCLQNFLIDGDVVILTPEYIHAMFGSDYGIVSYVLDMCQKNTYMFEKMNYKDNKPLFDYLLPNLSKFKQSATGEKYSETRMDDYGALLRYRSNNSPTYYSSQNHMFTESLINETSINYFHYVNGICTGKGAKFYVGFVPYNKNGITAAGDTISNWQNTELLFRQRLQDIPLISNVENYIFEGQCFYDSNYHLSTEGTVLRTTQFINDLKAQIAKEQ